MRASFCVFAVLALCVLSSPGQESKTNRSTITISTFHVRAGRFLELTEAQRLVYTAGLMDGFFASPLFGATEDKVNKLSLCTKDMENTQVTAIIEKYVREHPQTWHLSLSGEAYNALIGACPGVLR